MFLTRLIYVSAKSENFDKSDIQEIIEVAKEQNGKNHVTGMLCFNRKYFLQCLEGSRNNVNQTYHRILNDPRHTNIVMLDYKEISVRDFSDWSMGYVPESSLTEPTNIKFSGTPEFDPYEMSGESAHEMMLELKEVVPKI